MSFHLMYDTAGSPANIKNHVKGWPYAVAGYVDGNYRSFAPLVSEFYPHSHILSIAVSSSDNTAAFLDCEKGDVNPANTTEIVEWVAKRIKAGAYRPGVYASLSTMGPIRTALAKSFARSEYRLWVADWTGKQHLPSGYDACQFATGPYYDTSVLADDFFPSSKKKSTVKKAATTIHPKTAGSAAGAAIGVGVTAILKAVGVHVTSEEAGAISTIAGAVSGYITPAPGKRA